MEPLRSDLPLIRAKLIFNPVSGAPGASPGQLMEIITGMQALNILPEVYLIEPGKDVGSVVEEGLHRGIHLFVVSGGDGTVDSVAWALSGTRGTLGIIPTGTQNNVALSLGIPFDIPGAVALLRAGRRVKVDMGMAECEDYERPFLEVCSVGLLSALFPAADDIQHGNLGRIGDLLSTLVSFPTANMRLVLDKRQEIQLEGHLVLVANLPYTGPHYPIAANSLYNDGLLDVLVFDKLTKLDLISSMVGAGFEDPRIKRYLVHNVSIETDPAMPILADGFSLGEGPLHIHCKHRTLAVIAGSKAETDAEAQKKDDALLDAGADE